MATSSFWRVQSSLGSIQVGVLLPILQISTGTGNRCGHNPLNYDDPRWVLPSLNLANGNSRQQRHGANVLVMNCYMLYMDLTMLQVCPPYFSLSHTTGRIAKYCGLGIARVKQSFRDLKMAGFISVTQCRIQKNGKWIGLGNMVQVSAELFEALGLGKMFKIESANA